MSRQFGQSCYCLRGRVDPGLLARSQGWGGCRGGSLSHHPEASLGLHEPRSGRFQRSKQARTDTEILCKPLVVSLLTSARGPKQGLGGLLIQGVKTLTLPVFKKLVLFIIYLFSVEMAFPTAQAFLWRAGLLSSRGAAARPSAAAERGPGVQAPRAAARALSSGFRAPERKLNSCAACSTAHAISLNQGSNPCLPPWQAESCPLSHQGSANPGF